MDIGLLTNIGNVRQSNQDSGLALPEQGLFVVADGMGGHDGGEMASAMACHVIPQRIAQGDTLTEAFLAAHQAILADPISLQSPTGRAPGSTVVAARVGTDGQVEAAWVGDSRIYLWRKRDGREQLLQVSRDHSVVQELVDAGIITPEQAKVHPHRNIITQVLGLETGEPLTVDVRRLTVAPGERLLLCSDGLNGEITNSDIQDWLGNTACSAQQVCQHLVDAALEAGGHDNVTVLVIGF